MKLITRSVAALAVTALSVGGATAIADSDNQSSRQAVDTKADYTPFDEFAPPCQPRRLAPARAAGVRRSHS